MKEFYYILTLMAYVAGCYGFAWVYDRLWWMYVDFVLAKPKRKRARKRKGRSQLAIQPRSKVEERRGSKVIMKETGVQVARS